MCMCLDHKYKCLCGLRILRRTYFHALFEQKQAYVRTFSICYAVGRNWATNVDHATAIRHFILTGVFTGVVVVDGMHDPQIQEQTVQNLKTKHKKHCKRLFFLSFFLSLETFN